MRRALLSVTFAMTLALTLASPLSAQAQREATVVMTAERTTVGVGETFQVQVQVDLTGGDADDVELPDLSEFEVVRRSMQQPMSMRFGFGQQQPLVRMTKVWRYTLRARQAGSFVIPPTKVRLGSRSVRGNWLTIVVVDHPTLAQNPRPSAPPVPPDDVKPDPWDPDQSVSPEGLNGAQYDGQAFLQTTVDRADPFIGQQVTVTVYLYTRTPLSSAPSITSQPSADGFWTRDLLAQRRSLDARVQRVSGVPFRVYLLERFAAFPLREGELTIGAPEVDVRAGSVFDIFRAPEMLHRAGVPVVMQVRPLPDAAAHAQGVVGQYRVESSLDRHQVATGDALTLTASIQGRGNLSDVRPTLPPIDGLRVLAPRVQDDIQITRDVVGGTRRMEWLVVPERPGTYIIPALGFEQFDPETEQWTRVEAPALTLLAAGNAIAATAQQAAPEQPQGDITRDDTPLHFRPIHPHAELLRAKAPVSASAFFPFALAAPPLLFLLLGLGLAFARRTREKAQADPSRAAIQDAKARLRQAKPMVATGDAKGVYDAASSALLIVTGARIGESARGLTLRQLEAKLLAIGADDDLARRVVNELESCDFARFSSAGVEPEEMTQALKRASALVDRLAKLDGAEASS